MSPPVVKPIIGAKEAAKLEADENSDEAALIASPIRSSLEVSFPDPASPSTDDEEEDASAVQLRGLPFRATVEDVLTFLKDHAVRLKDDNSIRLLLNRHGRPSGFARVQFRTPEEAQQCRDALHMKSMEDRYVEVFIYSDWPKRTRSKKAPAMTGDAIAGGGEDGDALAADVASASKEQVLAECRDGLQQLAASGQQGPMLLSTLGALLSAEGRAYLRRTDQGLKHFLSQYPDEFMVEGTKGCEAVVHRGDRSGVVLLQQQLHQQQRQPHVLAPPQQMEQQQSMLSWPGLDAEQMMPLDQLAVANLDMEAFMRTCVASQWADVVDTVQDPFVPPAAVLPKMASMPPMPGTPQPGRSHQSALDTVPEDNDVPVSPTPMPSSGRPLPNTPSDWGTPSFDRPSSVPLWASLSPSLDLKAAQMGMPKCADLYGRLSKQSAFGNGTAPGTAPQPNFSLASAGWPQSGDGLAGAFPGLPCQWPSWPGAVPFGGMNGMNGMNGMSGMNMGGLGPSMFPGALDLNGSASSGSNGNATTNGTTQQQGKFPNPGPLMQNLLAATCMAQTAQQMSGTRSGLTAKQPSSTDFSKDGGPVTMNLAADLQCSLPSESGSYQAAVRLRGLPFDASEQDILTLFSQHGIVDRVEDSSQAVQLLRKPNGRPSGQAVVQLRAREDADLAQRLLHGQWMGNRYVEVFACDGGIEGRRIDGSHGESMTATGASSIAQAVNGRGNGIAGAANCGGKGAGASSRRGGGAAGYPRPQQQMRVETV